MKSFFTLLMMAALVFVVSASTTSHVLADFPAPFVTNKTLAVNTVVIVGETADAKDIVAGVEVVKYLYRFDEYRRVSPSSGGVQLSTIGIVRLDSEISNLSYYNAIVVGGPCANNVTSQLLGNPDPCYESVPRGGAIIKLIEQPNGNYALIINGRDSEQTRLAVEALIQGRANVAANQTEVSSGIVISG